VLEAIADSILTEASARAPVESGALGEARRRERVVEGQRVAVRFGFSRRYAAFQDAAGRTPGEVIEIRPKKAKALFVPLHPGARRHRPGADPAEEGFERGLDYVLASKVKIKVKPAFSAEGPNKYFSESFLRGRVLERIVAGLGRELRRKAVPRG
jgi:hypothetical protein